jgi:hypothetical protein
MFGYGSPVGDFLNKEKPPGKFSPEELKEECIARIGLVPNADPRFIALAEKCPINTAYVHVVRDCQAVKRWDTNCVTLIGDAVFKYVSHARLLYITLTSSISTMLGKGANCAMLDAIDLAESLRISDPIMPATRQYEILGTTSSRSFVASRA